VPEEIAAEVIEAYRGLGDAARTGAAEEDPERPFVAIRSSAREEDDENAARAGEFETFLFVRGEDEVVGHLKRAWSGLWTERALHNREVLGRDIEETGGGIIVQRIAWSRVSGVLVTVNVPEGELREMVINAGLGLGEGIVSGLVAADQVVVSKEGDLENAPLRFRYITGDKTEQVVFNARAGLGTIRSETLYHQRLRPALEYVELRELVAAASRLEAAYGYPLDIEFGIEGTRLWILQARPVATFVAALRETVEKHPLPGPDERAARTGTAEEKA
jgi:pyruvate,water dikinase